MKHRSEGACSMSCIILCYGKHDMLTWCDASKVTLCRELERCRTYDDAGRGRVV